MVEKRSFPELRVNVRSHLLATNLVGRTAARALFDEDKADLIRLLNDYADKRITGDQGRRMLNEYRSLSQGWTERAEEAMSFEILAESLGSLAQRVDTVSSRHEALAAIKERDADTPCDVVFMDWRMPGMDGLQATRLIKNDAT